MIDIKFIGTGGAFDVEQGNSAAWVKLNGKTVLLDCGHSVYPRLARLGLANSMDYILLTHLHDDHAGSLSTLIFHQRYIAQRKAQLLYPTADFGDHLFQYLVFSQQNPYENVDFLPLWHFPKQGIKAIDSTNSHVKGMMTFGYVFEDEEEIVLFSGDTGDPHLLHQYLHEHPTQKKIRIFQELTFFEGVKAHCYYKDLTRLAEKYEVYGYHLDKKYAPADNTIPLVIDFPKLLL